MRNFGFLASLVIVGVIIGHLTGCSSEDAAPAVVDCSTAGLTVSPASKIDPTSCAVNNGQVTLSGNGGSSPYQFRIESAPFQPSSTFDNLGAGTFSFTIRDKNGCQSSTNITLNSPGNLVITDVQSTDTTCGGTTGSITVTATGSSSLFYRLNGGTEQSSNNFQNLSPGNYTVAVRDNANCVTSTSKRVFSGVKYVADVQPILSASCQLNNAGCHGGGSGRDWNVLANVQARAQEIKRRIALPSNDPAFMPRNGAALSSTQINQITCWANDGAPDN